MTAPRHASGVPTVIGVDAGCAGLSDADHLVHRLVEVLGLPADTVGCTHLVRGARPHTAVSFALPDADAAESAWERLVVLLSDPGEPPAGAVLGEREFGPVEWVDGATTAAAEHARRDGGRAVVFPGVDLLTGTVTLERLLADSAVDRVSLLGSPAGDPRLSGAGTLVMTRGHVRPTWQEGDLLLPLVPAAGGVLAPFEVPNPTPCCADHDHA
ncbi:hypothetical protein ACFVT5_13390 [Streptomyces sp. NPDC058001]|uniref:hypothetical protein n=1 Tax=Streptomyces sp. NPDC058001 TaxID=3346300 RepID=UPI0036E39079